MNAIKVVSAKIFIVALVFVQVIANDYEGMCHRANAGRHFRDCPGIARPKLARCSAVGNCAMLSLISARRAHAATRSTPRYRVPASNRLRQARSLSADVLEALVEECNFVFHKLYLIQ